MNLKVFLTNTVKFGFSYLHIISYKCLRLRLSVITWQIKITTCNHIYCIVDKSEHGNFAAKQNSCMQLYVFNVLVYAKFSFSGVLYFAFETQSL